VTPSEVSHGLKRSRGAALAYVMVLLALVGILVALGWRYIRFNDSLVTLDRWDTQALLLAHSGVDYALYRIGYPPDKQNLAYDTDSLDYRVEDSSLAFNLAVKPHGLFARARSLGETRLPAKGRTREVDAVLGESMDLGSLPAIGLMNHEGNMVLAGNTQITGPVMLWRGDVRKATDYNIRYSGKGGHDGPLWDSLAPAWKKVGSDFTRATDWIKIQEKLLAGGSFAEDPDYDSGEVLDMRLPDSAVLADTVIESRRLIGGKFLKVGAGCRLKNCKLLSYRIQLDSGSRLEDCIVFANRVLLIRNAVIAGGQFVAHDTLKIATDSPLQGWPLFYVHGRKIKSGQPDSSYVGTLVVDRAQGEGTFISAAVDCPVYHQEIQLAVRPDAHLKGLLYCSGYVEMAGQLTGSLICHNLRFEYAGTIWLGHLKDAQLTAMGKNSPIRVPLLFPGWPPRAAITRQP
jgi:hypothetical protein